jgi:hypothetical protein
MGVFINANNPAKIAQFQNNKPLFGKISKAKNPSQQPSPQTRSTPPAPLADENGRFVCLMEGASSI